MCRHYQLVLVITKTSNIVVTKAAQLVSTLPTTLHVKVMSATPTNSALKEKHAIVKRSMEDCIFIFIMLESYLIEMASFPAIPILR